MRRASSDCLHQSSSHKLAGGRSPSASLLDGLRPSRGSISKAKQVLAEAISGAQGGCGLMDAPSVRDTGVLSPLLAMIRTNCRSRSSCYSREGSTSVNSSQGSTYSSSFISSCSKPSTDRSIPDQQEQSNQKVLDCLDTVCYLAIDDANRMALVELGGMQLMLSKLPPSAATTEVQVAALRGLVAIARSDNAKRDMWEGAGGEVLLDMLASPTLEPMTQMAYAAVKHLAWSSSGGSFGSSFYSSSSSNGDRHLLEPRLVATLASVIHPNTHVSVLLAALNMLYLAAKSPDAHTFPGWQQVLFKLVPLLSPGSRRGGYDVLSAALHLLLQLGDIQELRNAMSAAGCLVPVMGLLFDPDFGLKAACLLTVLVDTKLGQERLCEESALCMLLRVLQHNKLSVDAKLAVVYVLKRLSAERPVVLPFLLQHSAVPVLYRLVADIADDDLRQGAMVLLRSLGSLSGRMNELKRSLTSSTRPIQQHTGCSQSQGMHGELSDGMLAAVAPRLVCN